MLAEHLVAEDEGGGEAPLAGPKRLDGRLDGLVVSTGPYNHRWRLRTHPLAPFLTPVVNLFIVRLS